MEKMTLKKLVRPFLMKFHPDRQSVELARDVNLRALQTLNGMIDTIDRIYMRANPSSATTTASSRTSGNGRIELHPKYMIEFLIPTSEGMEGSNRKSGIKKPKFEPIVHHLLYQRYHDVLHSLSNDNLCHSCLSKCIVLHDMIIQC